MDNILKRVLVFALIILQSTLIVLGVFKFNFYVVLIGVALAYLIIKLIKTPDV